MTKKLCIYCKYDRLPFTVIPCVNCWDYTEWVRKKISFKERIKNIIDTVRWYLATH